MRPNGSQKVVLGCVAFVLMFFAGIEMAHQYVGTALAMAGGMVAGWLLMIVLGPRPRS